MSWSSSTTSTRAGRASMDPWYSGASSRTGRFHGPFIEGSRAMATRSRTSAPARRKPAPRAKRGRPARRGRGGWGLPHLEQRHQDLIGLALVAVSVFFAFVIWLRWDGGQAGSAAVDGLEWLVGAVHVVVPVVCMGAGALLIL